MSDTNGNPGSDGSSGSEGDPGNPYGGPPAAPQNPYGQPPAAPSPYGQAPAPQPPYDQPPYGQAPYGQPGYGQPPVPPGYGAPVDPHKRPGTVTAAGVVTLVVSGLVLALFALTAVVLVAAREEVTDRLREEPGFEDLNPDDLVAVGLAVILIIVVWCAIAMVLAVFAMRRSNVARIALVVSSSVTALLSLLAIMSGFSAITLIAAAATIVCLFVGGAGAWYQAKNQQPPAGQGGQQF